jgi:hypothetical protein
MQSLTAAVKPRNALLVRAANEYANVIREFAALESNPVLELLQNVVQFELDHKYPADPLSFAHDHWRAYYHSHVSPISVNGEHGHFHFFCRVAETGVKSEDWTHVAGLSIDMQGQPLMWFTVNQWVTGDAWVPAEDLFNRLELSLLPKNEGLLLRWTMTMLCLYRDELRELLIFRDRKILSMQQKNTEQNILQSRSIYELSSSSINVLDKLSAVIH